MNGLPSADSGTGRAPAQANPSEQLRSLLRKTSRESKVIFGAVRGVFDLDRAEIENFFHIIDQRVREQNIASAAACEFCVYYNDATSRRFPSIDEFNAYTETRNRFPTVFTVHASYFITFPDSGEPEKQEIDLVIRASESTPETIDMVSTDSTFRLSGDKIQFNTEDKKSGYGILTYTINHTKVSWGLDIEGHIRSQIDKLLEKPSKGDRALKLLAGPLNIFTTLFVGLYIINLIIDGFFWFLFQSDGATAPTDLTEIAAGYIINGHIAKYIVATLAVSVVFFVIFSGVVSRITRSFSQPRPSFITLCDGDKRRKQQRLKSYERRWSKVLGMFAANVAVGLMIATLENRLSSFITFLTGS